LEAPSRFTFHDGAKLLTDFRPAVLVAGAQGAGRYSVTFDGSGLASGVYYFGLEAGTFRQRRPMILVK